MTITIGPPEGDHDLLRHAKLSQSAFYSHPRADPDISHAHEGDPERNRRLIRVDGQVAGGLNIIPCGQWFGGRSVPMAAIGAVVISPEHRSSGLGSRLMADCLGQCHARGLVISTLYPASLPIYRKAGYEQAGANVGYVVPISAFTHARRDPDLTVRRARPEDDVVLRALQATGARRTGGNLDRPETIWKWKLDDRETAVERFLVLRGDETAGYVIFSAGVTGSGSRDIQLRDHVALDRAAARAIVALLGTHVGNVEHVRWTGSPADPLFLDLTNPGNPGHRPSDYTNWLTRVVDLPGALRARGYPAHVAAELHLEMRDPILPANDGRWLVRVADGAATVEQGGEGRIRLTPRGLASVYTGYLSPFEARDPGTLDGPDDDLAALAAAFAGPTPWMPDFF